MKGGFITFYYRKLNFPHGKRSNMEEKYLSDVIDYERDIEPFRFIFINAGVGAGKNTWAESLFNELKKNVLFITSRAITADVFATKVNAQRWKMNNDVDLSFVVADLTLHVIFRHFRTYHTTLLLAPFKLRSIHSFFDKIQLFIKLSSL